MFEWWATVEPVAWAGEKLLLGYRIARNFVRPIQPAHHWRERLNTTFGPDLVIHRALDKEPELQIQGLLKLDDEQAELAEKWRSKLKFNDPVATFTGRSSWNDDPVSVSAWATDYASVCALDQQGKRPTMLSANALLFCAETDEVVLHRRSDVSRDYPDCLHTFGGAYIPPGEHSRHHDHFSLVRTAQRETLEECGIGFDISPLPKLILGQELNIGFLHLALLGVGISKGALEAGLANHEGKISRVKAAELTRKLRDDKWVPAGKAQVLAWLALGAPVGRHRIRFGTASGQDVFNDFVRPD